MEIKLQTHDQGYVTEHLENVNTALQKTFWIVRVKAKITALKSCPSQFGTVIQSHVQTGKMNLINA